MNNVIDFKSVMKGYPSGVSVITTDCKGVPVGMTINSFVSVSVDPIIVSWCIDKKARNLDCFMDATQFAVNILSVSNKQACFKFADNNEDNKFSHVDWNYNELGLPIIESIYGLLLCNLIKVIEMGDHFVIFGEVFRSIKSDADAMLYVNGDLKAC